MDKIHEPKKSVTDLALFSGRPVFSSIRSASNLVAPDQEMFFNYARSIFQNKWITNNGPLVIELENRLADLHGTHHAVCCCSGFVALQICMYVLALPGKKEIIMPSLTYRRMADIATWAGLVPVFCDVEPKTRAISAETAKDCITSNTGLILGVHPIVSLCDIEGLQNLAEKHNIPLLFDSVEAVYASYHGVMIGSFGKAEVFSMHASKLINSFEGGYITTNNSELAERLRCIRGFGFQGKDTVIELGLNAKLNEIHSAVGLCSLNDLKSQIQRNRARHTAYADVLADIPGLELVRYDETEVRSFKNNIIKITSQWPLTRLATIELLHAENILARPYYYPPLHKTYKGPIRACSDLSTTESLSEQFMLLPSGDRVSIHDIEVIGQLLKFVQTIGPDIQRYSKRI